MYLVNRKTGHKICLAKYYPSTGWFTSVDCGSRLNEAFHQSDFSHLSPEERDAKLGERTLGGHKANYDPPDVMYGDQWELADESRTEKGVYRAVE